MIHVCFGLYDKTGRYSKFTGTAMLSMFENTNSKVTVHLLHDNTLTPENRDKFSYVAGQYGQLVKFYNVETLCADKIAEFIRLMPSLKTAYSSIATMYRLLLPQLLYPEIEKIIYLDSDIVVNLDIKELWQIKLNGKALAAIPESFNRNDVKFAFGLCKDNVIKAEDYFNAGVLLINLNVFQKKHDTLIRAIKAVSSNPEYKFFDQDVLNYCFSSQALKLSVKFNHFTRNSRAINQVNIRREIYHFAGSNVGHGYGLDFRDPFNRLWMKYFAQTPWFDEETIGRLYAGVQQLHVGFKQSMVNITALMSGKTRAFFALPDNVDGLKRFFQIRDDEEIITADSQESLNKLLNAMNASRGKKVFFIMLPNFPFQILIQAGFAPGRDFVNGLEFLSEAQGLPLNSYPLIQAM